MPQTPPFTGVVPRKLTDTELARAIRLNLEAELDAVNLYASHIDATDNEEAKRIIRYVMNEEKEHAALFWRLIRKLDPDQAERDDASSRKYEMIVGGASEEEVESADREGDEGGGETPMPKRLTVGGLKKG